MELAWGTLNIGTILTVLFGLTGFYFITKYDIKFLKDSLIKTEINITSLKTELKNDMSDIKDDLKALNKVMIKQAASEERLNSQGNMLATLQRELSDLRRGNGFIQRDVMGEYSGEGKIR
jgi:hypothetical protein